MEGGTELAPAGQSHIVYASTFWIAAASTTWLVILLSAFTYLLSPSLFALTAIICLSAYVAGIPLGILSSSFVGEASSFRDIGGFAATSLSGHILSKLDASAMEKLFASATASSVGSGRVLLAVAFLVLGALQAFILRRYWDQSRRQEAILTAVDKSKTAREPGTKPGDTEEPEGSSRAAAA